MSAEQAIDAFAEMLLQHIAEAGYPEPAYRRIDEHLKLTREELRAMTAEELGEVAFEVNAAAFAVGDEYNRQRSIESRCQTELAKRVGKKLPSDVYNRDDKWMTAALKDPQAEPYWLRIQRARTVCLRLEGQSIRLAELAKSLNNLIFSRR